MAHDSVADLAPDGAQIVAFCAWWFERTNKGVLEIGWIDAATGRLTEFEQFERHDTAALAVAAAQANMVPGQSCYIRAATVAAWPSGGSGGAGRTSDKDFLQAPGIWSDIDSQEDFERARTVETLVRPNGQVITGTVPNTRVQSWFRCSDPIVSAELLRSLNVRLHRLYGGDPSVVNPSRLMRLPGTIAWPRKEGRVAELVRFIRPPEGDERPRSYPLSMLTSLLPVLDDVRPGGQPEARPTDGDPFDFGVGGARSGAGGQSGGLTTVSRHLAAIRGGRHWHVNVIELVAHWIGRGWSSEEILGHCPDWTLPGYTVADTRREVVAAIRGAREKWGRPDTDHVIGTAEVKRPEILSLADLDALPPPTWLVHGLIPERSLVVPYGPPKSGKTFVVLSAGLHIAAGLSWFGYPVQQGAVVYIAGEGVGGLSLRLKAMRARYGIATDVPFWVIPRAVNLRVPAEVDALEAIIRATIGDVPLRLLVVDTLARAMPGADENSAQEVGAVIAAADYLKDTLRCTVALVHHEGKDGERGARGTSALRGAWDAAFQITGSKGRAKLTVVDQKDAEAGQSLSFIMEEVPVGIGRSSLVPVLDEGAEPDQEDRPREITGHAGLVLRALQDVMAGPDSAVLPPLSGLPTGDVRGVPVEALRRIVYERMPSVSSEARQKAFVRSIQNLMRMRAIGVRDPWVWLA